VNKPIYRKAVFQRPSLYTPYGWSQQFASIERVLSAKYHRTAWVSHILTKKTRFWFCTAPTHLTKILNRLKQLH